MDLFSLFLIKLSQPFIKFIGGCWTLIIRIDKWWTKKTDYTKLNLRWIIFTTLLFIFAIYNQIEINNANIINYNRNITNVNILNAKIKELENWKINRLESEISELKKIQQIALENEKEIQRLNHEK
jgi:hypothetical protein